MVMLSHSGEWKTTKSGGRKYVNGRHLGFEVRNDMTFIELKEKVYATLNLDPSKVDIELACRYISLPEEEVILDNDEQVRFYANYNLKSFPTVVSLCVTIRRSSNSRRRSPPTIPSFHCGTTSNNVSRFAPKNNPVRQYGSTSYIPVIQDPPHVNMPYSVNRECGNDDGLGFNADNIPGLDEITTGECLNTNSDGDYDRNDDNDFSHDDYNLHEHPCEVPEVLEHPLSHHCSLIIPVVALAPLTTVRCLHFRYRGRHGRGNMNVRRRITLGRVYGIYVIFVL